MKRKITYSIRAIEEQIGILDYVFENFGKSTANEVFFKMDLTLDLISKNPEMYPVSRRKRGLRKCVFSPQTSIYYRIKDEEIEIISFRPNRIDSHKLKI